MSGRRCVACDVSRTRGWVESRIVLVGGSADLGRGKRNEERGKERVQEKRRGEKYNTRRDLLSVLYLVGHQ